MKKISRAGACLERSMIRLFLEEQERIAKTCDDMISFTVGEPDFIAPPNVALACIRAIAEGKTKYAPNAGLSELKEAVSQKMEQIYGKHYDASTEIVITNSGMDGLRLTFAAILDEGDEVIVGDPAWSNHPNHPVLAGGKSVRVPLREENNFTYRIEDLEAAVTDKTRAVLLNSPNNPTGAVIQYEDLLALCDFVTRHDLYLVSDEVYYNIIFDGMKFWSPAMIDGMKDRTIIIQSFSKTYAMTGWRLGVNTAVQWAGIEALSGEQTQPYLDMMVASFQERRDVVYRMINEIPGLSCVKPQGAFYAFVNIAGTGMKAADFATKLLRNYHVGLVPGTGFGPDCENYVRISYATSMENICEGIRRIGRFVADETAKS